MNQVVGVVLFHLDFFKNDAALTRNVVGVKDRVQDQVAQYLHGLRDVLVQDFHAEADAFLGGKRIQISSDRIGLTSDLFSSTVGCAFEHHMLDKMGYAVGGRVLVAGACA